MGTVLALVVGVLFGAGIYLMSRRSVVKLIIGLALLSHAVNLLIFAAGGLTRSRPPVVPEGARALAPPYADPIPQALILTAIVISFGVLAFAVVLILKTVRAAGGDDLDELRSTET